MIVLICKGFVLSSFEKCRGGLIIIPSNLKVLVELQKSSRTDRILGRKSVPELLPIEKLPESHCCLDNCVSIAQSHANLLQQWRERAAKGATERRHVIAEMLTPSGESHDKTLNIPFK